MIDLTDTQIEYARDLTATQLRSIPPRKHTYYRRELRSSWRKYVAELTKRGRPNPRGPNPPPI